MDRIVVYGAIENDTAISRVEIQGHFTGEQFRMIILQMIRNLLDHYYNQIKRSH